MDLPDQPFPSSLEPRPSADADVVGTPPRAGSSAAGAPELADGTPRQLHPDHVLVRRLAGWIQAAVLGGMIMSVAMLTALLSSWPLPIRLALVGAAGLPVLGLAWLAHFWPAISYRHRWFRLDETTLEIGRGVIWRQVVTVPRSRVQHMDVNQGPIERRFGLAHLVAHTAGTMHASVVLDGLDRATAVALRDHLLGLLGSGNGDAV